jgi:hypothetical protein
LPTLLHFLISLTSDRLFIGFSVSYPLHIIIAMSAPGAGHEFPAKEVSWQKRDVLLFANSIGVKADELHFLYVGLIAVNPRLYIII